ncbi:cytosine permease [Enterobacter hormaechei]|uniref:purine-cytosine permease family protein n=1 Tax=Enterobacter hormaechei TaxID=158836 RepID=UPI003CF98598
MSDNLKVEAQIQKEAEFGILPMRRSERQFGFWDALFVLSGYGIATWSYTQGGFMATLLNFKQLTIASFAGNIFILALYLLPVVFATRYGMDMWQWLKAVFGTKGIRIMVVLIIGVNFPWFGVNADILASTVLNFFKIFNINIPQEFHKPAGLIGIALSTWLAIIGPPAIKWVNRFIVPALLAIGVTVVYFAFTSVPFDSILAYQPDISGYSNSTEPYAAGVEAAFAFGLSWCCSTAVIPRLCKTESAGYWSTVLSYGVVAPFFVLAGGALAIVVFIQTGGFSNDLAVLLSHIGGPGIVALTLFLIVLANIGTHGTGAYLWAIVFKSAFPNASYRKVVIALGAYAALIVVWGKIIEFFGAMISVAAYVYGPVMALLFVDYFFVRNRKLDLRSAYEMEGHNAYVYSGGYNYVGFACLIIGVLSGLAVFDPINYKARLPIFDYTTSSLLAFAVTAVLYYVLMKVPSIKRYMVRDRRGALI